MLLKYRIFIILNAVFPSIGLIVKGIIAYIFHFFKGHRLIVRKGWLKYACNAQTAFIAESTVRDVYSHSAVYASDDFTATVSVGTQSHIIWVWYINITAFICLKRQPDNSACAAYFIIAVWFWRLTAFYFTAVITWINSCFFIRYSDNTARNSITGYFTEITVFIKFTVRSRFSADASDRVVLGTLGR